MPKKKVANASVQKVEHVHLTTDMYGKVPMDMGHFQTDSESTFFVRNLSSQELEDALEHGSKYLKVMEKIRVDQKYQIKDQILDKDNTEYGSYDSRSLDYMLEKIMMLDYKLLELIEEEIKARYSDKAE